MKLFLLLLLFGLVLSSSINLDSILLDDDEEDEEDDISIDIYKLFSDKYGNDYGYNQTLGEMRSKEMKRLKDATYLDYTGAGVYWESQIRKCADLLVSDLYGNAHSVNPSSSRTESIVFYCMYDKID